MSPSLMHCAGGGGNLCKAMLVSARVRRVQGQSIDTGSNVMQQQNGAAARHEKIRKSPEEILGDIAAITAFVLMIAISTAYLLMGGNLAG
jgi:hypothetical protein